MSRAFTRRDRLPEILFAIALVFGAPFLMYMHRGIGTIGDEWSFLIYRPTMSMHDLFGQVNGHLMLLPALLYSAIRNVFEPAAMVPLAIISTALQLTVSTLVFVFVRRRGNAWFALLAAVLVLFLGTGSEAILWSFNLNWLGAMAAGLGALLVFERADSRGDLIWSTVLLMVAICCSGVGLIFIFGILTFALWRETRTDALKVVAVPVVFYVIWFLIWGLDFHHQRYPSAVPHFFNEIAAFGFGGLIGETVDWGRAVAVAAAVGLGVWLHREKRLTPAITVVLAMPLFFWAATALQRAGWAAPDGGRYVYTSVVLILLALAEATRSYKPSQATWLFIVGLFVLSFAGNLAAMKNDAAARRGYYLQSRAELTAMVAVGPKVLAQSRFDPFDPGVTAENKLAAYDLVTKGGLAGVYSQAELRAAPQSVRDAVDKAIAELRKP